MYPTVMSTLQIVTVGWRRMFVLGAARNTLTVNHSPTAVPSAVESITVMVEEDGCSDTGDVPRQMTQVLMSRVKRNTDTETAP